MDKVKALQKIPLQLSDLAVDERPSQEMTQIVRVDRIDNRGDIREHLTRDGKRTICGIEIGMRQMPCGNATCRRCEKILARLSETTGHGVMEVQTT